MIYSQALSKIERGHNQDVADVAAMIASGTIEKIKLVAFFTEIEPQLFRYPAIDPEKFAQAVERIAV